MRRAFTLIELVIVLLVLGILAAVAAPRYVDSLHRFRAEAAAKRIAADLRYAGSYAEQVGLSQDVQFSSTGESYTLPSTPDIDHPEQTMSVALADTPYPAVIVSADFGGDELVTFDVFGGPDTAGTVVVQSGGYQWTVNVNNLGQVSVSQ